MRRPSRMLAAAVAAALLAAVPAGGATGDPLRSAQWALEEVRLPGAWKKSKGCRATIAIVDTGVDLEHPDLRGKLTAGIDLVDGDRRPDDENGHGTHVAGIAAAATNNGLGIAGAAPCATIMPVRVLDAKGRGDDATIAEGIRWAAEHGARVINLSLGETGFAGRLSKGGELNAAIRDASAEGAVVVAAAGNDGSAHRRSYRVAVPVILVGAIAPGGEPAEFSSFGDPRTLVAPGVDIVSTVPVTPTTSFPRGSDGYAKLDGTSMAAPYVSGVAALLVAQGRDAAEIERILFETARDGGGGPRLGAGIVDASAAVSQPVPAQETGWPGGRGNDLAWLLWVGGGVACDWARPRLRDSGPCPRSHFARHAAPSRPFFELNP